MIKDLTPLSLLRALFGVACLVVAVLSLLPGELLPPGAFDLWDKAQHALAFLALGLLGFVAFARHTRRVGVGLLAYGAAIELAQAASGWRFGDWQDWTADAVGVAVAWGLWRGWTVWMAAGTPSSVHPPGSA